MYIHKVFFISKLSLGLALAIMVVRTVTLPWQVGRIFVPAPASGTESIDARFEGAQAERSDTAPEDYSAIVSRNIFGDANSSSIANKSLLSGPLQSAEDELGLALVGTISGSPAVSRAIIKDIQTNMLDQYKTGQPVGNACVESIEKNAVILFYNGQRKMLTLKTGAVNSPAPSVMPDVSENKIQDTQSAPTTTRNDRTPAQVPAKIGQIESMLGRAVIEPYVVDGQTEGLKVTGLDGIREAKDLGLKNGDIIRAVNGQQVTSMQKAYQIFKKARKQAMIDIELLRGNEPQKLSFTLR